MIDHHTVSNPVTPALIIDSLPTEQPAQPSRLSEIIASSRRRLPTLGEWFTDVAELFVPKPAWTTPTFEVVADCLPVPDARWRPIVNPKVKVYSFDGRTVRKARPENAQKRIAAFNAKEILDIYRHLVEPEKAKDHFKARREWDALHYVSPATDLLACRRQAGSIRPFAPKAAVLTPEECERQSRNGKTTHGIKDSDNFITRDFAEEKLRWVNRCYDCQEYVEQEHDCKTWCKKKALAEVKGLADALKEHQTAARKIERQRAAQRAESEDTVTVLCDLRPDLPPGKELVVSGYALKSCVGFKRTADGEWEFAPPSITAPAHEIVSDDAYLRWANKMYHTPTVLEIDFLDDEGKQRRLKVIPFETWWAEQCQLRLKQLNLTVEAGQHRLLSYHGTTTKVAQISDAGQIAQLVGGSRGTGKNDYRADSIFEAKHPEKRVAKIDAACKRCGESFVAVRKSHKYCSKNCTNRSSEANPKGEN